MITTCYYKIMITALYSYRIVEIHSVSHIGDGLTHSGVRVMSVIGFLIQA